MHTRGPCACAACRPRAEIVLEPRYRQRHALCSSRNRFGLPRLPRGVDGRARRTVAHRRRPDQRLTPIVHDAPIPSRTAPGAELRSHAGLHGFARIGTARATGECDCVHVLELDTTTPNGAQLGVGPGDSVCVRGGARAALRLFELVGSDTEWIEIRNREGVVEIDNEELGDGLTVDASATSCSTTRGSTSAVPTTASASTSAMAAARRLPTSRIRPRRHRDLFWAC
jgi:hypothetical protein